MLKRRLQTVVQLDVPYALTLPNVWAFSRTRRGSAKLLSGDIEGEPGDSVAGVSDRGGLLSLEIVTPGDRMYVVRRSVLLGKEPGDLSMLAYRKPDLVVAAPAK